jgi:hypothetical protein
MEKTAQYVVMHSVAVAKRHKRDCEKVERKRLFEDFFMG